eukprot:923790-Amphidinium_carterae.1
MLIDPLPLVMKLPFDDLAMLFMLLVLIVMLHFEKQRKLFSKVLGLYPATSGDARSFKKRKLTAAL